MVRCAAFPDLARGLHQRCHLETAQRAYDILNRIR